MKSPRLGASIVQETYLDKKTGKRKRDDDDEASKYHHDIPAQSLLQRVNYNIVLFKVINFPLY